MAERLYFFGGRGAHRSTQAEGLPALGQAPGRRAGGKALPFRGGKALLWREGFTSAGRLYFGGEALLFRGRGGEEEGLTALRQRGSPHPVTRGKALPFRGGKALPFRGGKALLWREGFTSAGRLYFGGEALLFRGRGGEEEGLTALRQRGSPHPVTRGKALPFRGGKALPFRGGKALLRRRGFTFPGGRRGKRGSPHSDRGAPRTQAEGLPALGHSVTQSLGHSVTRSHGRRREGGG